MASEFGRRGVAAGVVSQARPKSSSPEPKPSQESSLGHIWALLFSFDGRIPRLHYWFGMVGVTVAAQLGSWSARAVRASLPDGRGADAVSASLVVSSLVMAVLILAFLVLVFWISLSIQVRRWHDRDKSWTWAFLGFIPVIGWLWQGIECGFLEGTLGPNRFGPSPKGIAGVSYEDGYASPLA